MLAKTLRLRTQRTTTALSLVTSLRSSSITATAVCPAPVQVASRRQVHTGSGLPRSIEGTRGLATTVGTSTLSRPLFDKILIANRGEIACRVMRTAQALGIKCVAVFSEADRNSMHVKMADEAYLLGPALASESYLRADKILEICRLTGAQAVHPGYGFLSENAKFAQQLEDEGLVFIGPPASAIVSMGSKSESKDIMLRSGVPCVPGWHPSSTDSPSTQHPDFLILEADKIGYPVLIKAVSGGGGKGMKIVESREEFVGQLESAKREAMKGFGDDTVLLEKYLSTPRHVEVQIFSDKQGNHVSLFERDCSVQRRHQKIIEEAPAPGLSQELREDLYDKARKAAAAVNYVGAGTVEFIMDANDPSKFFFMEMNTRLQVEHPVTEAITGVDLVQWQLEVAAGNPIPLTQAQLTCTGHAFECRIYAENPANNFLPDTGLLRHVRPPATSTSVRMETGFSSGDEISVFYDPLIAKLIVHSTSRTAALRVLRKALAEYQIVGPHTNIDFLKRLVSHESFISGDVETGFIPKHFDALFAPAADPSAATLAQAGLFVALRDLQQSSPGEGPWSSIPGFRVGGVDNFKRSVQLTEAGEGGRSATVTVGSPSRLQPHEFDLSVLDFAGKTTSFSSVQPRLGASEAESAASSISTLLGDRISHVDVVSAATNVGSGGEKLTLFNTAEGFVGTVGIDAPDWLENLKGEVAGARGSARAPMPSRIVQVFVSEGETVTAGTPLVMVEAMKTEHVLRAPNDGVVSRVIASVGELVPEGKVLVEFVEEETEGAESK